jgi:hypothetical protein
MPQLTPEYDRVMIYVFQSNDATQYHILDNIKLMLMSQEIRISEDYCLSDIVIIDVANYTLEHAAKVTLTHMKKYELCVLVSALLIRNVLIDLAKMRLEVTQ